jgi:hypothetical protein
MRRIKHTAAAGLSNQIAQKGGNLSIAAKAGRRSSATHASEKLSEIKAVFLTFWLYSTIPDYP